MPRTKTTRNSLGTILEKTVTINGRRVKVWDARKRYAVTRPDGSFLRDARGRKVYRDKTRRCYSKSEANAALLDLPAAIAESLEPEPSPSGTFRELVERFRASQVRPAVFAGGRKVAGYRQRLSDVHGTLDLLAGYFGDRMLGDISYDDLAVFRTWYAARPTKRGTLPAYATVNHKMSMLRRLFNFAIEIGWLDSSPFRRGRGLIDKAGNPVRNRMLTFEEEARLLAACLPAERTVTYRRRNRKNSAKGRGTSETTAILSTDRTRLLPLIVCALDTAMRRSELFALRWHQVDLERRVILLTGAAADATKTGTAGILPMTDRLHAILSERSATAAPDDPVFERYDFKRAFAAVCRDAGIQDLQFRDLRSTAATRMILAGNSESQVMKITRHTRLKTLVEHYVNVDEEIARQIGKNLSDFVAAGQIKVSDKVKLTVAEKR